MQHKHGGAKQINMVSPIRIPKANEEHSKIIPNDINIFSPLISIII